MVVTASEVIGIIISIINSSYGNLGYTGFRLHSLKPNHKINVYITKYSFIPRDAENKRIFFEARIDIKDKKLLEVKEIPESNLTNDN